MIRPKAKTIGLSPKGGRKPQTLMAAARHNLRDIQKELGADSHIDAQRICLNETLVGPSTPAGIVHLAQSLREGVGYVAKRHDFTQAHEWLFTLPPDTAVDTSSFFMFCLNFIVAEFGDDSILSAVIHRDESEPHLHALLIPIAAGRYVGSSLITKPSLKKLIDSFAVAALKEFKVNVEKTLTGEARAKVTQSVHAALKEALEQHISEDLMAVIQKAAARNPASFMGALHIERPSETSVNDGGAGFRRTALSKGKGGRKERWVKPHGFEKPVFKEELKPYGFGNSPKNIETISCVVSPDKTPPEVPFVEATTRHRDDDSDTFDDSADYCIDDSGDFYQGGR